MLKYYLTIAVILSLLSCTSKIDVDSSDTDAINTHLMSLLQECIDDSFGSVSGVSMSIKSPLLSHHWEGAAGSADKELSRTLTSSHPFRIASVTKTFVAAAIMRLHEIDSLSIEEPISHYIDQPIIEILKSDGYEPSKILIKHCLNHTSGLFDYAVGSEHYINAIIKNPNKKWTRKEQLQSAITWGDKLGAPGELTDYSDSGYILLGAIIEGFFEGDLGLGLRELLNYQALGLSSTWLEDLEVGLVDKDSMVHRYHGFYETTDWDASVDLYGGGGLVSTTHDLAVFFYSLFNGEVYDYDQTLELMLSKPNYIADNDNNEGQDLEWYNYGMWTIEVHGEIVHLHTGFWGTVMLYIPRLQTSISVNTTNGKSDRLIKKTIALLQTLKENQ